MQPKYAKEHSLRLRLWCFLQVRIEWYIQSVPKKFAEHHSACKVAIAHIELLIKLARWADLPDVAAEDQNGQVILAAMMQQAEDELNRYKAQEEDADDAEHGEP